MVGMKDAKRHLCAQRCPAVAAPVVLVAEGLCLRFPQREVVNNLSLRIPPGITLVRGGESTGKTTLLRVLAGVLAPDRGRVGVNGISLYDDPAAYRQQVFWAEVRSDEFDKMIVADYLRLQQRLHSGFDAHQLAMLLDGFSLGGHLDKLLYMLSTGSKRKVRLAAAFASGAAVTLLDDPLAALDTASVRCVLALLRDRATHPSRAWVVSGYEALPNLPLAAVIDLGD